MRSLLSLAVLGPLLALSNEALAVELAQRCAPEQPRCETADVAFSKLIELPIQGGFDTGWVPANSPLQVHLFAQLYAETSVELGGRLETTWPEALTLTTPGTPGAGNLGIHYGVDIGAEASVTVQVLGQTYNWTGAIPFVPQFDFQVEASNVFDPWAFDGVSVSGSTTQQTLAQVDVTDFIGINIPGLSGGFALDTYVDLEASYRTNEVRLIRTGQNESVAGGAIVEEDGISSEEFAGGGSINFDVQPIGEVVYVGTLHLVPNFYIDTIGPDFSIPIADIPIPFEFVQKDWTFDPVTVHVPLPDIAIQDGHEEDVGSEFVLNLGSIMVGETASASLPLRNEGEENLVGTLAVSGGFALEQTALSIDPGATSADLAVSFTGEQSGVFLGSVVIASNDPDEAERTVQLRVEVIEESAEGGGGSGGGTAESDEPEEDGCDCRAAGSNRPGLGWLALGVFATGLLRRRQRRSL